MDLCVSDGMMPIFHPISINWADTTLLYNIYQASSPFGEVYSRTLIHVHCAITYDILLILDRQHFPALARIAKINLRHRAILPLLQKSGLIGVHLQAIAVLIKIAPAWLPVSMILSYSS